MTDADLVQCTGADHQDLKTREAYQKETSEICGSSKSESELQAKGTCFE
jgi:hypothetical protein